MQGGTARQLAEAIRADENLLKLIAHALTPELRSAITRAGTELLSFADPLRSILVPVLEGLVPVALHINALLSEPHAGEYEQQLIQMGYEPVEARIFSYWVIRAGPQNAKELSARRRQLGSAMLELVNAAGQGTLVLSRRAARLVPVVDEWTRPWIKNVIESSGLLLSLAEFEELIRAAAARDPGACARLREVAPRIFRHIPKARGASLSMHNVTHALLLMIADEADSCAGYTYDAVEGDYVDPLTAATRRQLKNPKFNPSRSRQIALDQEWVTA